MDWRDLGAGFSELGGWCEGGGEMGGGTIFIVLELLVVGCGWGWAC